MSEKEGAKSPELADVQDHELPADFTDGLDGEKGVKSAALVAFFFLVVGFVMIVTNPGALTSLMPDLL